MGSWEKTWPTCWINLGSCFNMEAVNKLIAYVIPIVVLVLIVIFFFGGTGGFEKVKSAFSKAKEYVKIGTEEVKAENPTVPEQQIKDIVKFKEALEYLKSSQTSNCFYSYPGFSPLNGKAKIIISSIPTNNQLYVRVLGGADTKQDTGLSFTIDGLKPCVIAGGSYPKRFEQNFLTPDGSKQRIYYEVSAITIAGNEDENNIDYGTGVNDFEAHQWLYKPDGEHVCFFPTVNYGTDEDGLDNEVIPKADAQRLLDKC